MRDTGSIQSVSRHLGLNLGIGLCRAVKNGHSLGIRDQLLQKIDLLCYRCQIRGTGHIAAGCIVACHQTGFCRICHCGKDDGNLCGGCRSGLCCRCGDGEDQIITVVDELLGNGLAG